MTPRLPNVQTRLARAGFWTVAGMGTHLAAGMIASVVTARILGPLHFGELSMTRTTLFTITLLAGANVGVATSRAVASQLADPAAAGRLIGLFFNVAIVTSGVAAALCILFAAPIARQLGAPQLNAAFAVSAPYVVFASLSAVQIGALTGLQAFKAAGTLAALEGVVTALLLVSAAY